MERNSRRDAGAGRVDEDGSKRRRARWREGGLCGCADDCGRGIQLRGATCTCGRKETILCRDRKRQDLHGLRAGAQRSSALSVPGSNDLFACPSVLVNILCFPPQHFIGSSWCGVLIAVFCNVKLCGNESAPCTNVSFKYSLFNDVCNRSRMGPPLSPFSHTAPYCMMCQATIQPNLSTQLATRSLVVRGLPCTPFSFGT